MSNNSIIVINAPNENSYDEELETSADMILTYLQRINKRNVLTALSVMGSEEFKKNLDKVLKYLKAREDKEKLNELNKEQKRITDMLFINQKKSRGGKHKRTRKTRRARTRKN